MERGATCLDGIYLSTLKICFACRRRALLQLVVLSIRRAITAATTTPVFDTSSVYYVVRGMRIRAFQVVIGCQLMTDLDDRRFGNASIIYSVLLSCLYLIPLPRINASTIYSDSCPHLLHLHQRNSTSNTASSTCALRPWNRNQVYANNPALELALQFFVVFRQYDISGSAVRPGVAGRAEQRSDIFHRDLPFLLC